MVSTIEKNIKARLDPIRRLVHRLTTNAPHVFQVSQGGEGCSCPSKDATEDSVVVLAKVICTQITTSIPIKLINSFSTSTTSTTTTTKMV